jgi:AraC-like DNA-binding protein
LSGKRGIDQIAASVGHESQAAFNRSFKRHVGLPPAAWRTRERIQPVVEKAHPWAFSTRKAKSAVFVLRHSSNT